MDEERRSGCSGENLRGLGLVLYLFTVTSAEESEERGRERKQKIVINAIMVIWSQYSACPITNTPYKHVFIKVHKV